MITGLEISNYRGITHGELIDLAPLSLLVGPNSSGKTSVLEAIVLAAGPNMESVARIIVRRGWIGDATVAGLLPSESATLRIIENGSVNQITLTKMGSVGVEVKGPQGIHFQVSVSSPAGGWGGGGTPSARAVTSVEVDRADVDPTVLDRAISRADLRGERPALIELVRPLLPGLKDLRILQPGSVYALHVEDDSRAPWPAAMAGDGLKKLLILAAKIAADSSGIIVVEEPETYLHVGALSQVAKLFWQAVLDQKKQIIAATHSLEFIDALFAHPGADIANAALFRLSLRQGRLKVVRVAGEKVRELRADIGEDLRK
jgi:predicted ATPase